MITLDRNMRFQSNLRGMRLAVIVLHARNNGLPELERFMPEIEIRVANLTPGLFPIELVDGERMVELMQRLEIGVTPRTVFDVDERFFDEYR